MRPAAVFARDGAGRGPGSLRAMRSVSRKVCAQTRPRHIHSPPALRSAPAAMEGQRMREALKCAMLISKAGNLFFQETEIWVAVKTDKEACASERSTLAPRPALAWLVLVDPRCSPPLGVRGNPPSRPPSHTHTTRTPPPPLAAYVSACAGLVALVGALLQPFMPSFSRNLQAQLGVSEVREGGCTPAPLGCCFALCVGAQQRMNGPAHPLARPPTQLLPLTDDLIGRSRSPATLLPAGQQLGAGEPTPLFRKITDEEVGQLRERFAGNQADRAAAAAAEAAAPSGKAAAGGGGDKAAAGAANGSAAPAPGPGKDKGGAAKKDKGGGKAAAGGGVKAKAEEKAVDVSRVDLRVGLIRKAWRHPDAER